MNSEKKETRKPRSEVKAANDCYVFNLSKIPNELYIAVCCCTSMQGIYYELVWAEVEHIISIKNVKNMSS